MLSTCSLPAMLISIVDNYAESIAIEIRGQKITYAELFKLAYPLVCHLRNLQCSTVAIYMDRNLNSYISIFACVLAGITYMPISIHTKIDRICEMLAISEANLLIIDDHNNQNLIESKCPTVSFLNITKLAEVLNFESSEQFIENENKNLNQNPYVYILFTSGSTGTPKAIRIEQNQLLHYLYQVNLRYKPNSTDRFSQIIELTFDLAMHDIFLCWLNGACLCVFHGGDPLELATYIKIQRLSFWLSVPSVILLLDRYKLLSPGRFSTLRVALFCGESLSYYLARRWAIAAPLAKIENLYGPTEATIAFTAYSWEDDSKKSPYQIVPIGKPFYGLETKIMHDLTTESSCGETGELWLSGVQVIGSYLNQPELSTQVFIKNWYRTGDLAYLDADDNLHFKGRIDDQWQIRGQRIERLYLETQFRNLLKIKELVVIPSPVTLEGLMLGIALIYVREKNCDPERIKYLCHKNFESPFIPSSYHALDYLEKNNHGKVDYKLLLRRYQKIEAVKNL